MVQTLRKTTINSNLHTSAAYDIRATNTRGRRPGGGSVSGCWGGTMNIDFSTLLAIGDKDPLQNTLISCIKSLFSAAGARRKYAGSWEQLAPALAKMVSSQSQSVSAQLTSLSDLFGKVRDAEFALSNAEERTAEDLRDIVERYDVLFRVNEVYLAAKDSYAEATEAHEAAVAADQKEQGKSSYERNKFLLQAKIDQEKAHRQKALENLRSTLDRTITERARYLAFKNRRLTHAWATYGTQLLEMITVETRLFQQIRDALRCLHRSEAVPAEAVVAMEAVVDEQIASRDAIPVIPADPI